MQKPKIVALVSAYNEKERIASTVRALQNITAIDNVVVIDDASKDETAEEAKKAGAEVIRLTENLGKGRALNYAIGQINFDILLLVDGDLADSASQASKLIKPLISKKADMAIARFPPPRVKGGFGLVKGLSRWGIRNCCGIEVSEPLSGQRAIKKEILDKIGELESGFGVEVGLTIDTVRAGYRVLEVDTSMSHRETHRDLSGFVHRGRQFLDVLKVIAKRV